jgi:peptide/nickel transport system substrate-binding protein
MPREDSEFTRRDVLKLGAAGAGLLALGPVVAACGSSSTPSPSASAGSPKSGGKLVVGRAFQPTVQASGLDPNNMAVSSGNVYTADKIFETLYITDPAGKLQPWLAESYTVSSDGMTYTFALRQGVKFSDGTPMTADDVVFSIDRARTSKTGSMSFLDSAIKSISAVDANTVEFKLFQPWAPFVSDISLYANAIVPKNLGGASEKAFFANPVGTGPFMLKSWAQQGAEITMTKNPSYWQPGKPYVDEVLFKVILDDNQRVLQVQSGEVQIIDTVPPAQFSTLKSTSGLQVTAFPAWSSDLVFFNQKVPHFADRNVRRAIAYAIDTKQIAQATTFGTAVAGGSFFAPSLEFYDPNTPVLAYNLDAAKQEIAKSGYPKGFTTEILIPTGNQVWAQSSQIIQDSVKNIGITLKINAVDHAAYENDFRAFNYDIMINNAINDISDPDEWASFMVDAKKGGSDSFWTGYNNPQATKLVRQAAVEMDSAKRGEYYSQVQAIVAGDAPYVALTYPPSIYAWQASVHGFAVNPGGAYLLQDVWMG